MARRRRRKSDGAESGLLLGGLAAIIGLFAYAASNPGFLAFLVGVGLLGLGLWWWTAGGQRRRFHALRLADVDSMAGHDFERYVATLLDHQGYSTTVTKGSGDLGVDVIAAKGSVRYAVQTKRYSGAVPRTAVSDAVAGMAHYNCNAAMVVTTHRFTDGAQQLARSTGCVLVDRDDLARWILAFKDNEPGLATTNSRRGLPFLKNLPSGFMVAGAALVLWGVVGHLGQQGTGQPPPSASGQQDQSQQPQSPAAQYRDAILSMNPVLAADRAERLASSVVTSSSSNAVDARLTMAVLAVESNFDIGADPEAKITRRTAQLSHAMNWAAAQQRTELQRLRADLARYRAETTSAAGKNRHKKTGNRRRKEFARKAIRLYYQMCGKTPPW